MTQSLRLVCGMEIIYLSDAGVGLRERFIPTAPTSGAPSVVDTAVVSFVVKTDYNRGLYQRVNRIFELARHWHKIHIGNRAFVEFKQDTNDQDYYRSELMDGRLILETNTAGQIVSGDVIEANIVLEHVPYWEGQETPIPLADLQAVNQNSITTNKMLCVTMDYAFTLAGGPTYYFRFWNMEMDNLKPGDVLYISGASDPANNGAHTISVVTPTLLTLTTPVVTEAHASRIGIALVSLTIDGIDVYNPCATYTDDEISFPVLGGPPSYWIDDGSITPGLGIFQAGDTIVVTGSAANDRVFHVQVSTPARLTVAEATNVEAPGASITIISQPKNWVHILENVIEGDLPAPVRFELTNLNDVGGHQISEIYVAHNVFSSPLTLTHILEAEGALVGGISTGDVSITASEAEIAEAVWAPTVETKVLDWTVDGAQLDMMDGNYFRLLMRLDDQGVAYTDLWLKAKVYAGSILIWDGEWVQVPQNISLFELCTIPLPPYRTGTGTMDLHLNIYGKRSGTPTTVYFDYVQLSTMDGWRMLTPSIAGMAYTQRVVDDEMENMLYIDDGAGADKAYRYSTPCAPILLIPGMEQRLYFLFRAGAFASDESFINWMMDVKMIYRPRRSTI